jgi:hypothetical protein
MNTIIPATVEAIDDYAFSGQSALRAIDIPDSVTTVGDYAFRGCSSLRNVSFPEGLTSIGASAFFDCSMLNRIDIPQCLVRLLEDKKITKVGLSWHDDLRALNGRKSFRAGTFVELQDMAGQMGIVDISLQKLYANIFGQKISKGQRLTNWEADDLTEAQKKYAATDAWACIRLYEEMQRMQREGYRITQTHSEEKEKMEI